MGFFDSIKRAVGTFVKGVGNAIVGAVKSFFGDEEQVEQRRRSARRVHRVADDVADDVAGMGAYNPANAQSSIDYNARLGEYKGEAARLGAEFDGDLMRAASRAVDALAGELGAEAAAEFRADMNGALERLRGAVGRDVARRVSLGDETCVEILRERDGGERGRRLRRFMDEAIGTSVRSLGDAFADDLQRCTRGVMRGLERDLKQQQFFTNQRIESLQKLTSKCDVAQREEAVARLGLALAKVRAVTAAGAAAGLGAVGVGGAAGGAE